MELYEIVFDENEDNIKDSLQAISIVKNPAIVESFVKLSKPIKLEAIPNKRIVTGPVLIPDLQIQRLSSDGVPYSIVFRKDTIEKLSFNTMKSLYVRDSISNLEHNSTQLLHLSQAAIVESWIKTSEDDKSNQYFSLPIGTWFVSMKIENEELWERINNQEFNGFSIEGFLRYMEVKQSGVTYTISNTLPTSTFIKQLNNLSL